MYTFRSGSLLVCLFTAVVAGTGCEQPGSIAELGGAPLTSDEAIPTGQACAPTGAHAKHAFTSCTTCHNCGGVLQFDPAGAAVVPGGALPAFDAVAKTCSNVKCHGVATGTFSYWFPGGDGEPVYTTVTYGGSTRATPSWYTTGAGCTACHDNPPRDGSTGSDVWHSGYHGGQGPTGARNQCQLCHPDAYGANGVGTLITNPSLHANGSATVQAAFSSVCFGCH